MFSGAKFSQYPSSLLTESADRENRSPAEIVMLCLIQRGWPNGAHPRKEGEPDGRFLLRADPTIVRLFVSSASDPDGAVPHHRRGLRSRSPAATPIRPLIPRRSRPPRSSPATTWTTIRTIPSATRRTTPGSAAVAVNSPIGLCLEGDAQGLAALTGPRGEPSPGRFGFS
jgi:hypothetical protein